MKPNCTPSCLRILVLAFLLSGQARAADPASSGAPVRLDIDLGDNTTLTNAVALLLGRFRSAGENVNLILKNEVASHPVPPISLQQVTFEQAVKALELMVDNPPLLISGGDRMFVIDAAPGHLSKMRVFNVSAYLRPEEAHSDAELKHLEERIKTLRDAVQKGITFGMGHIRDLQAPNLEWAEGSGLLFATGQPEAVEIVGEVVRALCEPAAAPAPKVKP